MRYLGQVALDLTALVALSTFTALIIIWGAIIWDVLK
jgi:hypothetical protein